MRELWYVLKDNLLPRTECDCAKPARSQRKDPRSRMKGLEISRRFFEEWGLPFLEREYPQLVGRIAAGRVGGSDIIGADDEWSRDHDWGPWFELFLTDSDYRAHQKELDTVMNEAAPRTFLGYTLHFFGRRTRSVHVGSAVGSATFCTGRAYPPKSDREWFLRRGRTAPLVERESWLYFYKHGPVFYDPLGDFTAHKQLFTHHPRDVRLKLIAGLCLDIWYSGEHRFCTRYIHRKDPVTNHVAIGEFVRDVMRLCFLVNDDYAPHEVWLHHEFRKLPEADALGPRIQQLVTCGDLLEQRDLILEVCQYLRSRLLRAGLVDSDEPAYGLRCRDVTTRIEDRWIREM